MVGEVTTVKVIFFFETGVINCAFTFAMSYLKVLVELVATSDEQFTVGLVKVVADSNKIVADI